MTNQMNELKLRDLFKDTDELRILKRNGFRGVLIPVIYTIPGTSAQTAANFTAPFFFADRNYQVLEFWERHEVAGGDAGAVTIMLKKVPDTIAPASGTDILTATMDLKAGANTWLQGTITETLPNFTLSLKDALSVVTSGTLTTLQGVTVAVILKAL